MKGKNLIFIGADHAGFSKKEKLKDYLIGKGFEIFDVGAFKEIKEDDYPDYAFSVGEKVSKEKNSYGILICGSGVGVCIASNKVKGIRGVFGSDIYTVKKSREDDDTNVLCLSGRHQNFEEIKKIVLAWLNSKFSGKERHKRRIRKIERYE